MTVQISSVRRYLVALVLLVATSLVAVIAVQWMREPSYEGKLLSAWLEDFGSPQAQRRVQAAEAVRQMSGRAIPFLVATLRHRQATWKTKLDWLLSQQGLVRFRFQPLTDNPVDMARQRCLALAACDAIGSAAKGALPELEELLCEKQDFQAAYAMARIGPGSLECFERASGHQAYFVRLCGLYFVDILTHNSERLNPKNQAGDFYQRAREEETEMLGRWLLANGQAIPKHLIQASSAAAAASWTNKPK